MSPPERIQLHRTKGWRKPEGTIVVARPSKWGNPWPVDADLDAAAVVELYRAALEGGFLEQDPPHGLVTIDDVRRELAGHDLACWCPLDTECHADVLLELANAPLAPEAR